MPKISMMTLSEYQGKFGRVRSAFTEAKGYGYIDPGDVMPDPEREERAYSDDELRSLGEDMKARGQIDPITVYWSSKYARWIIIKGVRRWKAINAVGMIRVYCLFRDDEPTENEKISIQLVEELLREDMKPVEIARAFRQLMDINTWNATELAAKLHIHKGVVSRSLALLRLPDDVQEAVDDGQLPATAAYEISKAPAADQATLAKTAINDAMNRDEVITESRKSSPPQKRSKPATTTRRAMRTSNGATVTITHKRRLSDDQLIESLQEMIDAVRASKQAA